MSSPDRRETMGLEDATDEHWGLRDCTFRIAPGPRRALVGPNGAGSQHFSHAVLGSTRQAKNGLPCSVSRKNPIRRRALSYGLP